MRTWCAQGLRCRRQCFHLYHPLQGSRRENQIRLRHLLFPVHVTGQESTIVLSDAKSKSLKPSPPLTRANPVSFNSGQILETTFKEETVDLVTREEYVEKVDAVHCALNAMGFKDVEIVVAETGWPYCGDPNEVGPSVENANDYNGNLSKM
ncbi:glucan endo-1,3-beta-glucosidase 14-like [Pistacia vera]|uniref:glucan endo-1,3-beta-glucosidase 14-like n=1 Tax=Pistacia vera TaxID=55513 RepID=UPI001263911D|nr:glucan endo-1,3-beta-glucosidase 14-like [Pistacia vera]